MPLIQSPGCHLRRVHLDGWEPKEKKKKKSLADVVAQILPLWLICCFWYGRFKATIFSSNPFFV